MELYTIGKMALPAVVMILATAGLLTLALGVFTAVKTLVSVQQLFRQMEADRNPAVTIHIHNGETTPPAPMQIKQD